ncbi:MAG: hypothetical protein NTV23_08910 [Propionibacteriales bacterium]|nr:hypothetical protein [Propionibacteriales bacterium]
MKPRHCAHGAGVPRHLDRPKQWAQAPWLILGMVFIAALLVASQRVADTQENIDFEPPAGSSSQGP